MNTKAVQKIVDQLWTTGDLTRMTGKTSMTVVHWYKRYGLPVVILVGDRKAAIRFVPHDARVWAERRGVKFRESKLRARTKLRLGEQK